MNVAMIEKLNYEAPGAQIIIFPEQDIVTSSGGPVILPDDDWGPL